MQEFFSLQRDHAKAGLTARARPAANSTSWPVWDDPTHIRTLWYLPIAAVDSHVFGRRTWAKTTVVSRDALCRQTGSPKRPARLRSTTRCTQALSSDAKRPGAWRRFNVLMEVPGFFQKLESCPESNLGQIQRPSDFSQPD